MTRPHPQSGGHSSGTSRDSRSRLSTQYPNEGSSYGRTTAYTTQVFDQRAHGVYGYVVYVQTHAVPSPPAVQPQYDPQRDPQYVQVPRTSRPDHLHLDRVVNNPALPTAPVPSRQYGHGKTSFAASYQNPTARSSVPNTSSRTPTLTHDVFGNMSNAAQRSHRQSTTTDSEEYERRRRQSDSLRTWEREDFRDAPYNAVGYIRSDGEVYDEDEVYEEYREYNFGEEGNDASYEGFLE